MAISRMQQPRQMYGLGSLVKSIGKGIKGAVKGVTRGIKKNPFLALAALNFAPMIGGGSPFIGFGKGKFAGGSLFDIGTGGISELFSKKAKDATFGDTLKVFAGGSLLGGVLNSLEEEGDPGGITRNIPALRTKLTEAYRNQKTFADEDDEEAAIANQVEIDLSEYTSGAGGYAQGGRVKYAKGTPEQNAIEAAGIMGLPLNKNPAGVTELDLRETGGFIPPVGVKEKADDIPAMLSNNEFVFTADAVKGMGGGDVNKGAQRLYDQMKMLEKGGIV